MRFIAILVGVLVGCFPVIGASKGYQEYGDGLTETAEIRIGHLLSNPGDYVDKAVKVVGLVNDVCPMRGCWVEIIEQQTSERIRFKVQDNVVIFPVEAVGQEIIAEGILRRYEMSKDQATRWLAHLAEEKNEVFDPSTVSGPMSFYQIEGLGARIQL